MNNCKRGSVDVTTYSQDFQGAGELCLTDLGHLSGEVRIYFSYEIDGAPGYGALMYDAGELVVLDKNNLCVDIKSQQAIFVTYQVKDCYEDDVLFEFTPKDYTGGFEPPLPDPPVFTGTIPDMTGDEDVAITPYDASVVFSGDELTYTLTGAPADLVIDPVTGIISGVPLAGGTTSGMVVTATNAAGSVDSNVFSIVVTAAPIIATGATMAAGVAGTWSPAGAIVPANLAAMTGITATPATLWTIGSHMVLGDASLCHWSGTAWVVGAAL